MLDVNLKANTERYEVGDLNSTDVAQSRARQALGRSQLQTAEARLISSRENYIRLVGVAPGILDTPPPLPNMPADPDTAVDVALDNNANLLAAKKAREAADEDITIAKAGRLPRLNGVAGGNYVDYLKTLGNGTLPRSDQTIPSASIGLALQVPIYQGGRPSAQIRQAQARSGQAIEQVVEAERTVVAQTRSAYAIWKSSLGVIESAEAGVAANRESLDGVRAENQVGTRTILDVLNAQQELLNSRVTMVTAQRDAYVAGFALLAAMGRAEARDLGLDGGPLYDPKVNYDRVRNHLGDWETDPVPQGIATGTSEVPAQGAEPRLPLDPSLNVVAMAPE
jgi:outer membrane protein